MPEQFQQRLYGGRCVIQHNMGFSLQGLRDPIDTHRSPKAVGIRNSVPHHQYRVFGGDDLPQCMSLHPGLHSGIFLHLLALAAIISDTFRGLNHRLVPPPAQGQVYGVAGKLIILGISQTVQTHAYADGDSHLIADIDCLDLLQQFKAVLL